MAIACILLGACSADEKGQAREKATGDTSDRLPAAVAPPQPCIWPNAVQLADAVTLVDVVARGVAGPLVKIPIEENDQVIHSWPFEISGVLAKGEGLAAGESITIESLGNALEEGSEYILFLADRLNNDVPNKEFSISMTSATAPGRIDVREGKVYMTCGSGEAQGGGQGESVAAFKEDLAQAVATAESHAE